MALTKTCALIRGSCLALCLGGLLAVNGLRPATVTAASPLETAPAVASPVQYPGIEQLIPMSITLEMDAANAKSQVDKWVEVSGITRQIEENQQALLALDQRLAGWGPLDQWSEGRLLGALQRLTDIQNRQEAQLEKLSVPFKAIEDLHRTWVEKQTYWYGWQQALKQERVKLPANVFAKSRATIEEVVRRATKAMAGLSDVQQKFSAQQEVVGSWVTQVDTALNRLRGPLFVRNAPALFSRDYFAQFNDTLWVGLQADLSSITQVPDDFVLRQGRLAMLVLVVILLISWQIFRRASEPQPVADKWQFLFRHPVAGGVFIGLIFGTLLSFNPPPILRWLQLVFGTIAATILICAMLERPRLRRVIITLAILFVSNTTIQLVGLVLPLYRLFLVVVCAIATPLCLAAARRQRQRNEGRIDLLATVFYLGTVAGGVGLAAQFLGYANLSSYLVNAFLGTVFIYLFAQMALHLGKGAIDTLLETEAISRRRLVRRLGPETGGRLNGLLHVVIVGYAFLFLLVRWRIYPTPETAWKGILAKSFKIGELQVSFEIILMVVFVLYLSLILSWILQALLDAEVLTRKGTEHGVKIAIKTLVHYSMILLGFLVAVSVAGVDMSKFAILAGALGVGIGFGLQNIVNNFLSGLILLFERPVKVGDTVSIDNQWGTITKIGLRSTVVETLDRAELIVPNSDLIAQKVTNWTFTSGVSRVVLPVGVAYGTPLDKVLDILLKVARDHAEVLDEPAPSAIFTGFGQSSIDFELRAWIGNIDHRLKVRSELGLAVDQQFRAAGIVIPFPQRDLHLQSVAPTLRGSLLRGEQQGPGTAEVSSE